MNSNEITVREYLEKRRNNSKETDNSAVSCDNNRVTWKVKQINSSQLKSKVPYQRPIDKDFVKKIIDNFNSDDVEMVHVSYRDGKYYVMDGQHTILGCEGANGGNTVDISCIVHYGMTYEDEAEFTNRQYEKKHNHTYKERSIAAYEAGRKLPCELARKVAEVGARLPYDKNTQTGMKISAIKRVTNFYQKDPENTILAIRCLVNAYKTREDTLNGDIIGGTMEFLRLYNGKAETLRLSAALSGTTPQSLAVTARSLNMSYPMNWTETLRNLYNRFTKGGRKIKFRDSV